MSRISFGLICVLVVAVKGYYYNEYFPEARNYNSRKGDDLDSPSVVVNEVSRPDRWTLLKQRSENILRARRQRAHSSPYRQQTRYDDYAYRSPRTNIHRQQSAWQRRTYSQNPSGGYTKGYNGNRGNSVQEYNPNRGGYTKGYNKTPGNSVQGYNRNLGNLVQPYKHSGTFIKGPQTVSREGDDEYRPQSGSEYIYPQERVQVTTAPYVDARLDTNNGQDRARRKNLNTRPDTNNGHDRARRKNLKRKRNNRKAGTTDYSQPTRKQNNRRTTSTQTTQSRRRTSGSFAGCKDTGLYCDYWKSIGCCDKGIGEKYCTKTCGFCSPQQTICPSSYKFGCCWDGDEALDHEKSNCARCKDINRGYCHNPVIYRDCDLHEKAALRTRKLCPVTCGACDDFSSIPAR